MSTFIFDLDGTLADSRECLMNSLNHAFHSVGLPESNYCPIQSLQQDLASTFKTAMQDLGRPLDEEMMRKFIAEFRWFHEHEGEESIRSFEGIEETLENLKKTHVLAVATTKHSPQARRVLRRIRLDRFFDHIQGTDPGMKYKPDPDILLKTLRVLEIPTRLAAYVGDGRHDMTAARRGGLLAVGAAYGFGGDSVFEPGSSDYVVYHHRELEDVREAWAQRPLFGLQATASQIAFS
jgi:HAD superfamily hydrolase (TIGR01549 family)